jgi:exopolysaccharide production protein ExoQ
MMSRSTTLLGASSAFVLGVLLPLLMAPASKSSPLLLGIAAALALAAAISNGDLTLAKRVLASWAAHPAALISFLLIAFMAVSVFWAHDRVSSLNQLLQFLIPLLCGLALAIAFPGVAPRNRALFWAGAIFLTALIVVIDILTGLHLRKLTGGRVTEFSYNRAIVTLMLIAWPMLALIVARKQWLLLAMLVPLGLAVWVGESGAAVLALLIGVLVLPIAWLFPGLTRRLGLMLVLLTLATAPFIGTLSSRVLGQGFHQTLQGAHSSERVSIWLSFEEAAQKRWLIGNGFGSSIAMDKAPVAREVTAARVEMLGASHPHNAALQLWVELGISGAALAAILVVFLFRAIGQAAPLLQPFLLTWIAVVFGVGLVSHGAWQAWWVAAIAASAVGFITLNRELAQDANRPPSPL